MPEITTITILFALIIDILVTIWGIRTGNIKMEKF